MTESVTKIKVCKKNKSIISNKESLASLSQETLIDRILQLEAHNLQLRNILQKRQSNNNEGDKIKKKNSYEISSKRHVLLKFYYLGWDYQGFVTQEDTDSTIENFLFKALEKCCLIENRENCNYHRCGRTDKGVSAFSQVISIDLKSSLQDPNETNVNEELKYCTMLNRLLPEEIKCYAWCHVGSTTSARFDCTSRTYKYYFPKGNLNIDAMLQGAKQLVGVHDFRNFCKMDVGNGVTEFQREIIYIGIKPCMPENPTSGYQMFEFVIRGKSFLWHQIRCIMSILLLIGQEKESPNIIQQLLNVNENQKPQYSLASYLPLNLYHTEYEKLELKWNVDINTVTRIVRLLQSQWTSYSIKCTMIRDMLDDLQKLSKEPLNLETQADSLQEGVQSKIYKPLLSRNTCESLENKISHFIKKQKIEFVNCGSSSA